MDIKKLKPIPKKIETAIKTFDLNNASGANITRYYSYLTNISKELCKVTVAVKHNRKRVQFLKQVAVHGVHSDSCFVKDMEYCCYLAMGFTVGWYEEGMQSYKHHYEDGKWYPTEDRYYNPWSVVINKDYLQRYPEYKYSAFELTHGIEIFDYLRLYEEYPKVELMVKAGFGWLAKSKQILRLADKDNRFIKWLAANKDTILNKFYNIPVVITAYKSGRDLHDVQSLFNYKKYLIRQKCYTYIGKAARGFELEKVWDYLDNHEEINPSSYNDYMKACLYLKIDMKDTKNMYPKDFKYWHDIRINQYATKKAEEEPEEYKKLDIQFEKVVSKFLPLEYQKNGFVTIIAKSKQDLIREGIALDHCVGRMDYDQRIIKGTSLIFFIRAKATPDISYVTIEYSPKYKSVLQCYGANDHRPPQETLDYVNNVWLPYANKQLKKLKIAA